MKKFFLITIGISLLTISCNDNGIKKPKKLLDEDQMVSIIYDLSLLDGIKNQNIYGQNTPTSVEFLKKKYKIDSLTFAQNSQYYAADLKKYKRIYERVKIRLEREEEKINGKKKQISPEDGIVK